MKLLRLSLENWRGVTAREIAFADGVTLIEGPNEIGKSTIVEALRLLIAEMDSSNKQKVKAIQPVGQDVGSSVEAEIRSGEYHFIYNKTYNKNKQTALKVLAPKTLQLTGREAHERVEQILEQTVDMALWQALLVEQGKEVAGAHLADSQGLARALDEAAGTAAVEQDDSDLLAAVQREYEQYFTLKTGKARFVALEKSLAAMRVTVEERRAALAAVEQNNFEHQRCTAELRRLQMEAPTLQAKVDEHAAVWQTVSSLQARVADKQKESDAAQELLRAANDEQTRRAELLDQIAAAEISMGDRKASLEPLGQKAVQLKAASTRAGALRQAARNRLQLARRVVEQAQADERYLQATDALALGKQRLIRVTECRQQLDAARALLAAIRIDAEGLAAVRKAEEGVQIAAALVEGLASRIYIQAEKALSVAINDESEQLAAGAELQRDIAAQVSVQLPGYASIRITPSQSATDRETDLQDSRKALDVLLRQYAVVDLSAAVAAAERRAVAERERRSWSEKLAELLQGGTEADLQAELAELEIRCANHPAARPADLPLPGSVGDARAIHEAVTADLAAANEGYEAAMAEAERLLNAYNQADVAHKLAVQEVAGFAASLQDKQAQLMTNRNQAADDVVYRRAVDRAQQVQMLRSELDLLAQQLNAVSPDAARALFDNAKAVAERAFRDLQAQRERLAALEALLTQAQADGRFEALDAAERELALTESDWLATSRRASAAERLWQILNQYRDAARKAYVRPLKDGIEQLGRIVFGSGFSVELDDNWTLVSRTLDGITIPFDDLSIGAREQLGILTRLAAARIVSAHGGVPLIIDDALGFSDPARLETMGAAIAAAGQHCQVILLTCTPGRFMHVGSAELVRF